MTHRYLRRTLKDRNRPRVLEIAPGVVHESGPERDGDWSPSRVAVMAHWATDAEPTRSVVTLLTELAAAGYETVLVSAAQTSGPLGRTCTWAPGQPSLPAETTILRRANLGYDFGSWAAVLAAFPGIRRAPQVLLVNDSLIGPFASLGPILANFAACPDPAWGLSGSRQHRPHLQSFFMGFRSGSLDTPAMRAFWTDIRVESRKAKIVRYCELGLSEALDEAGMQWLTMFEPRNSSNATLKDSERLRTTGFPFVKSALSAATDQDISSWLPPGGLVRPTTPPRWLVALEIDGVCTSIRRSLGRTFGLGTRSWISR